MRAWRRALAILAAVPATGSEVLPPGAFADRAELQAAVDAWLANDTAAEAAHGHISNWDTSSVNSTAYLFMGTHAFNANLSGWDTSKVVTMRRMFHNAASFDGSVTAAV